MIVGHEYLQNLYHVNDLIGDTDDGDMVLLMNMMQKKMAVEMVVMIRTA